jgi:hypothetical protein
MTRKEKTGRKARACWLNRRVWAGVWDIGELVMQELKPYIVDIEDGVLCELKRIQL